MVTYTKYADIEIFEGEISSHEYPWHFHKCYTFIIVTKGSVLYEFQDKSVKVDETEVLLLEPFLVHRNKISQNTIYKAIFIPIEYFECKDSDIIATRKVNHHNEVKIIVDLLTKIKLNYSKKDLIDFIFSNYDLIHPPKTENTDFSISNSTLIPKIHLDHTINELAEKAHLSKFHFQRKFKKNYGLTIGQLKQQEKTIQAKTLIENGKLSTDVAYLLGFFDQSHFIKYFKKMWATTPKNF
jgi:AraC-like DNA-binding protein